MKRIICIVAFSLALVSLCSCSKDDSPRKAVDLGLSVKWASCNLGAKSPEDRGVYYAWGETQTKENFVYQNYKWNTGETPNRLTKYNNNSQLGDVDNIMSLQKQDDVARVKMGSKWRMPVEMEFYELLEKCDWIPEEVNGIAGYRVKSRINNNSIFIPAYGYKDGTEIPNPSDCAYWSSTVDSSFPAYAKALYCYEYGKGVSSHLARCFGLLVRPVRD
jgi:hypothetical protein